MYLAFELVDSAVSSLRFACVGNVEHRTECCGEIGPARNGPSVGTAVARILHELLDN
jgi:hypothetical protein